MRALDLFMEIGPGVWLLQHKTRAGMLSVPAKQSCREGESHKVYLNI